MNHCIGRRLSTYFGMNRKTKGCEILQPDGWGGRRPAYVLTLAVPEGMSFEASALEEYLIDRLSPPCNTRGVRRSSL